MLLLPECGREISLTYWSRVGTPSLFESVLRCYSSSRDYVAIQVGTPRDYVAIQVGTPRDYVAIRVAVIIRVGTPFMGTTKHVSLRSIVSTIDSTRPCSW
jgi:hypothetical protein